MLRVRRGAFARQRGRLRRRAADEVAQLLHHVGVLAVGAVRGALATEELLELHPGDLEVGLRVLAEAIVVGEGTPSVLPLVSHVVTARGVETIADQETENRTGARRQ